MTKNIAATSWTFTATGTGDTYNSWQPDGAPPVTSYPLDIDLTTAGRVGFYIDYSELSSAGTHKFYIARII